MVVLIYSLNIRIAFNTFAKNEMIFSEFFHTELTHVRNLKILCKVFYR